MTCHSLSGTIVLTDRGRDRIKGEEIMKTTFTKQGIEITVELKETELVAVAENTTAKVEALRARGTWAYRVECDDFKGLFGIKRSQDLYLAHESAKEMKKETRTSNCR